MSLKGVVQPTIRRSKKPPTGNASVSLSSPRGTTAARTKNRWVLGALIRSAKYNGDLAWLIAFMMVVFGTIVTVLMVSLAIWLPPVGSPLQALPQSQSSPNASPFSWLLSRFAPSVRSLPKRHPRGHRYFDYWQGEEWDDYEAYPWKYMKRPSTTRATHPSIVTKPNGHSIPIPEHVWDDESYVPSPTSRFEPEQDYEKRIPFNDPSAFYAELRKSYESFFPPPDSKTVYDSNTQRCLQAVQDLQTYTDLKTHLPAKDPNSNENANEYSNNHKNPQLYYDIFNCPETPPEGYPFEWNLVHEVLREWPADDPELPASGTLHQGLCVFDLQQDYEGNLAKALTYRNAEVPFVVKGDSSVAQTVERWNAPDYLSTLIGDDPQPAETSASGKFTYWSPTAHKGSSGNFQPPTQLTQMTFGEWMQKANVTDSQLLTPESPHYYFKVVGCAPGSSSTARDSSCFGPASGKIPQADCLADELPFFSHTTSSLYVKEVLSNDDEERPKGPTSKPILCRFGMKGVMATNHFDGERNFVTVLSGERRYILSHPNQCGNMALFPYGHPSARHSQVDWAHFDLEEYPQFEAATGNEVVLQAGDSLFLPSLWFHYIVSLSMNVQCNTRSGMDVRNVKVLNDSCGGGWE